MAFLAGAAFLVVGAMLFMELELVARGLGESIMIRIERCDGERGARGKACVR